MSGEIHIENFQAGFSNVGGQGNISNNQSGTVNNFADPAAARAELQAILNQLLRTMTETGTEAEVRHLAEQARTEADAPQPRTGKLRSLMQAVVARADQAGVVARAALDVINVLNKIPW